MPVETAALLERFHAWLREASAHPGIPEPTAMTLATAGVEGQPHARIVLLKEADERGFVFYTNTQSAKGRELMENAKAALCFYWMPLSRQVRVEGYASLVSPEESDAYFTRRARESQLGAWASQQSQPLENRQELMSRFKEAEARFAGIDVPRPPHWQGYRVVPSCIEFWQAGEHRLHRREKFTRDGQHWKSMLLNP